MPSSPDTQRPSDAPRPQDEQWSRQRQLLTDEGQAALSRSQVLVIGCGGLGAGAIPPLVSAGIGQLTLMDDDVVSLSNLNRQTLFSHDDLGRPKAQLAAHRMQALSPTATITPLQQRLGPEDVELVRRHDVVVDCTDRMASRAAISVTCRAAGRPWVWAAIEGWNAVLSTFAPGHAQWEDVVAHPQEAAVPPQVLGATPAMAGAWQAAEVVKLITGAGRTLVDRIAAVDLRTSDVRFIDLNPHAG